MNLKKIWIVTKIARQVDGEYIFVQVEKASNKVSKIQSYLETALNKSEIIEGVNCLVERGVMELDLEEYDDGE